MKKITLFLLSLLILFALVPAYPASAAGSGSRVDNYIYYVNLPYGTNWGDYSHYYATDWKMDTWDSFLYTTESSNSCGTSECAMPIRPDTIAAMQRTAEITFYYRAEDLPTGGRSHLRPNGDNGPKAITGTTKYSSPVGGRLVVTENIAEGYPDAQATLNAWLGSTHGHCAAIMDSISQAKSGCADGENNYGIQSVGVGYVVTEDGEIHSTIPFPTSPLWRSRKEP